MPTDNLVHWLAQGPLWLFAIAIALIVSIDVAVVEFTRDYESEVEYIKPNTRFKRKTVMGLWHAFFHAVSFFLYITLIYAFQWFAFQQIDLWDLQDGVGVGFLTIVNFIIICFIWWTYKNKIREDHSEKNDDSAKMSRRDMKLLVDAVRHIANRYNFDEQARGITIAASVAVDMLAISALLKIYLLPNGDQPAINHLTGFVLIDAFLFALIIFGVVFIVVFFAQAGGARFRKTWIVVLMRLAEPLAVFYIVAGTVRALMQLAIGDFSANINRYGILFDLGFSLAIVYSLIVSSGLSWHELLHIYSRRSNDKKSMNPQIDTASITVYLKTLGAILVFVLMTIGSILYILDYSYSTAPGRNSHNHLIEATGFISAGMVILTVLFLYIPSIRLDRLETQATMRMHTQFDANPHRFWATLFGIAVGLFALNAYTLLVFGHTQEVTAIILWSVYIVLTWALFDLRAWRFHRSSGVAPGYGRTNDTNFAEIVSALGVSSGMVAIAAHVIVTNLKP